MKKNEALTPEKEKKRRLIIIAIIVFLCILYIFFASKPLSREIHFVPVWTIDVDKNSRNERVKERISQEDGDKIFDDAIPYKLGQTAGYFTKNGTVISYLTFPYKAAISKSFYTLYGTHSENIPIFDKTGKESLKLKQTGFPHFEGDDIFIFLPGGSAFSKIAEDGSEAWTYEGIAPITAFSSSENGVLAGFADGNLISFKKDDGTVEYSFTPGGSDFPVILGAAVSPLGTYIATVSGQQDQRFVLAKKADGSAVPLFHTYLEKETNRQVIVKFSKNEDCVYYGFAGGLGIVNCKTLANSKIAIDGHILSIREGNDGTLFVLSRDKKTFTVSVIEPFDEYSGSFSFDAEHAFIEIKDDSLFVGHDSKISRIDIQHK